MESSAAALRALLAGGATPKDDLIARGLLFLDHEQDRDSLWYSTQATARALDVLADICTEGELSTEERAEYESAVLTLELVTLLQAEARAFLATHKRP